MSRNMQLNIMSVIRKIKNNTTVGANIPVQKWSHASHNDFSYDQNIAFLSEFSLQENSYEDKIPT